MAVVGYRSNFWKNMRQQHMSLTNCNKHIKLLQNILRNDSNNKQEKNSKPCESLWSPVDNMP